MLSVSLGAFAQVHYESLRSFGFPESSGLQPSGPLIEGSDHRLYGAAFGGGATGDGTIFCVNPDGGGYRVLHSAGPDDASGGRGPLLEGRDGALYGATYNGGARHVGCVFRLNKDGTGFKVLVSFGDGNGAYPLGSVIEGDDNMLYGTTSGGSGGGSIFRLRKDGSEFTTLHVFTGFSDGSSPYGELLEGSDGVLYGATGYGGTANWGTIFRLNKDGASFTNLHHFGVAPKDGQRPQGRLIEDQDGALFGVTDAGGSNSVGTVFTLEKDGTGYAILRHFHYTAGDGYRPQPVVEGHDSLLYGVTGSGGDQDLGTIFRLDKGGGSYAVLRSFTWAVVDATHPLGVFEGSDGFLYGTAAAGGTAFDGVVFKLARDGSGFEVVRSLLATGGDGRQPAAPLTEGTDGSLYGTCPTGGTNDGGVVFRLSPDGARYMVLHDFAGFTGDGRFPQAGLVMGRDGGLYGTTTWGGRSNAGTVFRLGTAGQGYTALYSFGVVTNDGREPYAGLLEGSDGWLYGSTYWGGEGGQGTLFRISKDGSNYSLLHSFRPYITDPVVRDANPLGPLVEGRDGALYGLTATNGVLFKVRKDGTGYRALRQVGAPNPVLVASRDGFIYGSTARGGNYGRGTVYRIDTEGTGFLSYSLAPTDGSTVGKRPSGGLVEGGDGFLYGATSEGGEFNRGALFRVRKGDLLVIGLHSFTNSFSLAGPALCEGADGCLYGLTSYTGAMGFGEIFQLVVPELSRVFLTPSGSGVQLRWKAVPGLTYRAQWTSRLSEPAWSDLPGDVVPDSINADKFDLPGKETRFYRTVTVR
jgi:uncharacterized repeat protein (TIGR03803 family)